MAENSYPYPCRTLRCLRRVSGVSMYCCGNCGNADELDRDIDEHTSLCDQRRMESVQARHPGLHTEEPNPGRMPLSIRRGSVWCWEPLKPDATEECEVTGFRWNGEEWWVQAKSADGVPHWNTLYRFVEAAVLVRPAPDGSHR